MARCLFCGEILNEQGVCPNAAQHFKPMCLSCGYCHPSENGESLICFNEDNKNETAQKIMQSYEGGYKITGIELSPLPLKDPTKKCKRYSLDPTRLIEEIKFMVG